MAIAESCSRYELSREKALELFATKGYGQVSMRELASHVGLTAGSLYHHFPSKQHLLFDLIEELYEELLATLPSNADRQLKASDQLALVIDAHLHLYQHKRRHFHVAQRDFCCLAQSQQEHITDLRQRYEQQLLGLVAIETTSPRQLEAIGHMIATLLKSIPGWLEHQSLLGMELSCVIKSQILHTAQCIARIPGLQQSTTTSCYPAF